MKLPTTNCFGVRPPNKDGPSIILREALYVPIKLTFTKTSQYNYFKEQTTKNQNLNMFYKERFKELLNYHLWVVFAVCLTPSAFQRMCLSQKAFWIVRESLSCYHSLRPQMMVPNTDEALFHKPQRASLPTWFSTALNASYMNVSSFNEKAA